MEPPEQGVIVYYALAWDGTGDQFENEAVSALEDRLAAAIDAADAGEFDGTLLSGDEAELYAYGPDAARLFAAMEPVLRAFPARPAHAVLRFGGVDDRAAVEQRIDL